MDNGFPKMDLDPLPPSNDDYWKEADVHTNLIPEKVHKDEPHYFVRKTGRSAQCTHCDWGFDLDPGDRIEDGHLYDPNGKRVI